MMHQLYGNINFDIAAKMHKKHQIRKSKLLISMGYNQGLSNYKGF
jgi:hypothetical protein